MDQLGLTARRSLFVRAYTALVAGDESKDPQAEAFLALTVREPQGGPPVHVRYVENRGIFTISSADAEMIAPDLPTTVAICAINGVGLIARPPVFERRLGALARDISPRDVDRLAGAAILNAARAEVSTRDYDPLAKPRQHATPMAFAAAFPEIPELAIPQSQTDTSSS